MRIPRASAEGVRQLLRLVADGVPFQILMAVPAIEVLFFQDRAFLEQLLGKPLTDLEWQLARQQPKQLLDMVQGGYQKFVETAISNLKDETIAMLRQHPLIQDLIKFLTTSDNLRGFTNRSLGEQLVL